MDCLRVREQLSSFHDDELADHDRAAVAEHLAACKECRRELDADRRLSLMAQSLASPEPPAQIWHSIEEQFEQEREVSQAIRPLAKTPSPLRERRTWIAAAAAASLLFVVGWYGVSTLRKPGHAHAMTEEFGEYLNAFRSDPAAAQSFLLAHYPGQPADAAAARELVGYRPAFAAGLPQGFTMQASYVLTMPCCTCVQCICTRGDGSTVVLFQHNDVEGEEWFGNRPSVSTKCDGKACTIVDLDDAIAATWVHDGRHLTAIGLRDTSEVAELASWFDDVNANRL